MTETAKDVYSFLIPMLEDSLILPNTIVAEIVPFMNVALDEGAEESNEWKVGSVMWRNMNIPVVSMERIQGHQDLGDVRRSRIAIVYTLNGNEEIPFVAFMVRGIPRLVPVDDDNSEFVSEDQKPLKDGVKAWLSVEGHQAVVPDLDYIESNLG
ncbi:chemotaxis protein CheW [Kangiella sediminilitoris]|uniref:CheW domain protein n=1 Tax=Kangiella sediminilitoris TaxID=1144748 RepID=A0A1B3BDH3_9GAMM|nr:chemotaxis protein CheW [Kangiella sediminilitoris]AOE50866.1 CheW domain protein [Kangiella sediminilitoris]